MGRNLEENIAKLETQINEKLDQISSMNNRDILTFLGNNESLSHILRGATEKLRINPIRLNTSLFTPQELRDIKNTLSPSLYNNFDVFLEDRQQNIIDVSLLRMKLRRLRSQL